MAVNSDLSTIDIIRNILNHNSIYLLMLIYFALLKTKFGIKYFGPGASFFNGGQAMDWIDAETPSGTISKTIDLTGKSGKAIRIGVLANSWQWAGNGDGGNKGDDTVIITVKKITFIP